MSGALDATARKTAERLLKKFGKKAIYTQVDEGEYNPSTGEMPITEILHNVTCFIDKAQAGKLKADGLINENDMVILVSAKELDIEVDNTDKISFDGKTYAVIKDMPDYSGELIALHNIVIKNS